MNISKSLVILHASLLILVLNSSLHEISVADAQIACEGIVEIDIPIRGTYLRAIDDRPYSGPGNYKYDENLEMDVITSTQYRVEDPVIVDLQANGFVEGDRIMISYVGQVFYCGVWNPSDPASTDCGEVRPQELWWGMGGVFSATSELLPINELNRVPTAINAGENIVTPKTYWTDTLTGISSHLSGKGVSWYQGEMATDIPEDFKIAPYSGMSIVIPQNAKYLFLSLIDVYYRDNLGSIKVTIEKDTDGDGIPDAWEQHGIDIDCDGQIDLDLPMLGADYLHKDIFVEIDYMNYGGSSSIHNHEPHIGSIFEVQKAFAKAPVSNPDGTRGINLHYYIDESTPHQDVIDWDIFYQIKRAKFGTQDERANPKIIEAKKRVYHYALFAHNYSLGSGSGEISGNDFFIALGDGASTLDRARAEETATFMHELGHNLGLHHGGNVDANYKPNYPSVMNYLFQFNYYVPSRPLDYSIGSRRVLRESDLDENIGIGSSAVTVWRGLNGSLYRSSGTLEIDWNADGNITSSVSVNLNDYPPKHPSDPDQTLRDYNDWENLVYRFRGLVSYADGTTGELPEEMTLELIEVLREEAKSIIDLNTTRPRREVSVGVEEGDWWEYAATYTENPPDDFGERIRIDVEGIQGNNITLTWTVTLIDGNTRLLTETYDLELGVEDFVLIEANLGVGDTFYHFQESGIVNIDYTEKYSYAGEERTILGYSGEDWSIHWDETTGVLTQMEWASPWRSSTFKTKWVLDKTSLWRSTGTGLETTLIASLVVVIAAILLMVLFFIRRKMKNQEQ